METQSPYLAVRMQHDFPADLSFWSHMELALFITKSCSTCTEDSAVVAQTIRSLEVDGPQFKKLKQSGEAESTGSQQGTLRSFGH